MRAAALVRAVVVAAVAASASACTRGSGASGGTSASARGGAGEAATASFVDYARCLREHGMDVPDPEPPAAGGGVSAMAVPRPANEAEQQAVDACARLLPEEGAQGSRTRDPEADAALRESLLAFAKCMRDQGVDYPDPRIAPNGGIDISTPPGAGTPQFQRAQEACGHLGGVHVADGRAVVSGKRP